MRTPGTARRHEDLVTRFVDACATDDRILAVFLAGSIVRGEADEFSDVDFGVVTTDAAFSQVTAERTAIARRLGDPLFVEDFGNTDVVFVILADGREAEISFAPERDLDRIHSGPHETLHDPRGILAGRSLPFAPPDRAQEREQLQRLVTWFWHDVSHLTAALGRGQRWWAQGQLEFLRGCCVNLLRIANGAEAEEEPFEKVDKIVPSDELAPLAATVGPLDEAAMLAAAMQIVDFFREHASAIAESFDVDYPSELAALEAGRLEALAQR